MIEVDEPQILDEMRSLFEKDKHHFIVIFFKPEGFTKEDCSFFYPTEVKDEVLLSILEEVMDQVRFKKSGHA